MSRGFGDGLQKIFAGHCGLTYILDFLTNNAVLSS
jgi:hypothetical protein